VALPDAVLLKAGPLNDDEKALLRDHPVVGERICSPLKSMRLVLPIIRHHHEKLDGSGYPDGLCGEAIPFEARILQVVDVYDALTTERSYRGPLTSAQALNLLKAEVERGWWDAKILGAFRQLLQEARPEMKKPPQKSTGPAARKVSSLPRKVAH
jgi:putative two-component system response regulator